MEIMEVMEPTKSQKFISANYTVQRSSRRTFNFVESFGLEKTFRANPFILSKILSGISKSNSAAWACLARMAFTKPAFMFKEYITHDFDLTVGSPSRTIIKTVRPAV
jgi:hypothetical protein